MTTKTNRNLSLGSFDFIKGAAICIIIFGHIALEFDLEKLTWYYPLFLLLDLVKTPLMPLFFIISGYGFKKASPGDVARKMAHSLLVPYALVMIAFGILKTLDVYVQSDSWSAAWDQGIRVILAFLLGLSIPGKVVLGYKLSHCAIVWFLLAAFWGCVILSLVLRWRTIRAQVMLLLGCAMAGWLLFQLDFTYFCLPHGLIAAGYFYVGYVLKKTKLLQRGLSKRWMYILWIAGALAYACWGEFDLCYGEFRIFWVDYFGVAILAVLVLKLGLLLGELECRWLDGIHSVGIYSYWVLCIHSVEQKCLPWAKLVRWTAAWPNLGFLLALVIKMGIITLCCRGIKECQKWKYRRHKRYYERNILRNGAH